MSHDEGDLKYEVLWLASEDVMAVAGRRMVARQAGERAVAPRRGRAAVGADRGLITLHEGEDAPPLSPDESVEGLRPIPDTWTGADRGAGDVEYPDLS